MTWKGKRFNSTHQLQQYRMDCSTIHSKGDISMALHMRIFDWNSWILMTSEGSKCSIMICLQFIITHQQHVRSFLLREFTRFPEGDFSSVTNVEAIKSSGKTRENPTWPYISHTLEYPPQKQASLFYQPKFHTLLRGKSFKLIIYLHQVRFPPKRPEKWGLEWHWSRARRLPHIMFG